WFIYTHTGGPKGKLTYVSINTLHQQVQEGGSPWQLSPWRRVNKIRNSKLKDKNIAFIRVTRAEALGDSNNSAIYVESEDTMGMTLFADMLEEGADVGFNDGRLLYGEPRLY